MSNHSVSFALNGIILRVIEGYIKKEVSENYVRDLILDALSISDFYDGNDCEVLADVSNSFCGNCLKKKDGDFFEDVSYCGEESNSLVKLSDSFFDHDSYVNFVDITNKFNFSKEDVSFLENKFGESCTKSLCVDCLKEAFDELTGSRDKTDEIMEYVYNNLK